MPTPTAELLGDYARLWISTRGRSAISRITPPVGVLPLIPGKPTVLHPRRWRRWACGENPTQSAQDLTHHRSQLIVGVLDAAGLKPFLVDADNGLHFGLVASDRRAALTALKASLSEKDWYIEWRRGHRTPVRRLRKVKPSSSVLRAEEWRVFRVHPLGKSGLIGYDETPTLSFWEDTGERYERLAHRGLNRFPKTSKPTVETIDGRTYPGLDAFPAEASLTRINEPVDIVYTWVDGAEPSWLEEFRLWRHTQGLDKPEDSAVHPSRYASHDELRYSFRSIWLNAGWARHVYIVTADQRPDWLEDDDRLTVVSHKDILPPEALPTFNSHAIEARLHHIEGLSEHFVYMNDDFFIGRPIDPDLFFTSNGLIKFHSSAALVPPGEATDTDLAVDSGAKNGRALLRERFGRSPRFKLHHGPYALRRSVMYELEEEFSEPYTATVGHRFRSAGDLSVASNFTQHYAYCTARAVPGEVQAIYQNIENARLRVTLDRVLMGRDVDVFCLNATEDNGPNSDTGSAMVLDFLDQYFPIASPWELDTRESR